MTCCRKLFQSQARCQAPGDSAVAVQYRLPVFQSQARCQAPGDARSCIAITTSFHVSISSEMPGPWRRMKIWACCDMSVSISSEMPGPWRRRASLHHRNEESFNLKRDARPLATPGIRRQSSAGFNLKRDARPLATYLIFSMSLLVVSISSEMPGPWRPGRS